jgi:hypothetical protein
MPFSIAEQIRMLGPSLFEELCGRLLPSDVRKAEGRGGDEGIDFFRGTLDIASRPAGAPFEIWQVKFFPHGLKETQRKQVEKSFETAKRHRPTQWTLVVPVDLQTEEHRWFEKLKAHNPSISLELLQAQDLLRLIDRNPGVKGSFLPDLVDLSQALAHRLEDFDFVSDLLESATLTEEDYKLAARSFYGGTAPNWRVVRADLDARREVGGEIWSALSRLARNPSGRVPFLLLLGRAGDGKTTTLRRTAADLVAHGLSHVYFQNESRSTLDVEQLRRLPSGQLVVLTIDQVNRFEPDALYGLFRRLQDLRCSSVVMGASISSLWQNLHAELGSVAEVVTFSAERLSDFDIDQILEKLAAFPAALGALAGMDREQQIEAWQRSANRQLLIAMIQAQSNQAFESRIERELAELSRKHGDTIRRACEYVSTSHRLGIRFPRPLLEKLLPAVDVDHEILDTTKGLLVELGVSRDQVATRHSVAANVILPSDRVRRARIYEHVVQTCPPDYEKLVGRMIRQIQLRNESDLAGHVLKIAVHQFPKNAVLKQMRAMHFRQSGDSKAARYWFKQAADAKNVMALQAWALLEKDEAKPDEARKLFQRAAEADPKHAPTFQAWAIFEKEQNKLRESARTVPASC